jgi:hypothetical protein
MCTSGPVVYGFPGTKGTKESSGKKLRSYGTGSKHLSEQESRTPGIVATSCRNDTLSENDMLPS